MHPKIRQLYLDSHSVSDIANALGITRATVYYHKNKAAAKGDDWDTLRYVQATNSVDTENQEKAFLSTLIHSFEKELKSIDKIDDPEKRLAALAKYASLYYKIKQPNSGDSKSHRMSGAIDAIYCIGALASQHNQQDIVLFLSQQQEAIIVELDKMAKKTA